MALIGLLPVLIFTVFRVNAATAYMALCVGNLLSTYVVVDLMDALRGYVAPGSQTVEAVANVLLLWIPVVLVVFFMWRTISSRQRLLNAMPGLAVGLVGVLLTVPLLTPSTQLAIYDTSAWQVIKSYQALIVVLGTVVSILLLRMRAPFGSEPHKGKKHHK